jgi:hypothetical protein
MDPGSSKNQGRWTDPGQSNPKSDGPNTGEHVLTVYARTED